MDNKKVKEALLKLAQIVKTQNKEIKKLATFTTQQLMAKVQDAVNSLAPVMLSDAWGGGNSVKLDGDGTNFLAYVTISVKTPVDDAKKAALKAALDDKFLKLDIAPFTVKVGGITFVEPGTMSK